MRRVVPFVVLSVLLAGCSSGAKDAPKAQGPDFSDLDIEAAAGKGVILGVVVDPSITPIAGAHVRLEPGNQTTSTDDQGRFTYADLEPGDYFLRAHKPGYSEVQSFVAVASGPQPRPTLIQIERLPGTEPYVVGMQWDGFMECSFTIAIAFGTGCLIGDFTNDDSRRWDPIEGTPAFLQSELSWDTTQALGTNLCMRHYASEDIGGEMLGDDVCGPSPLLQAFPGERLAETEVGGTQGIERVIWVDDAVVDTTFGLALNQQFTVFTHLFYNFVPADGWTFLADGAPVPPA